MIERERGAVPPAMAHYGAVVRHGKKRQAAGFGSWLGEEGSHQRRGHWPWDTEIAHLSNLWVSSFGRGSQPWTLTPCKTTRAHAALISSHRMWQIKKCGKTAARAAEPIYAFLWENAADCLPYEPGHRKRRADAVVKTLLHADTARRALW